jgi:hypothetical protein
MFEQPQIHLVCKDPEKIQLKDQVTPFIELFSMKQFSAVQQKPLALLNRILFMG